jgi:hypothetical protein
MLISKLFFLPNIIHRFKSFYSKLFSIRNNRFVTHLFKHIFHFKIIIHSFHRWLFLIKVYRYFINRSIRWIWILTKTFLSLQINRRDWYRRRLRRFWNLNFIQQWLKCWRVRLLPFLVLCHGETAAVWVALMMFVDLNYIFWWWCFRNFHFLNAWRFT